MSVHSNARQSSPSLAMHVSVRRSPLCPVAAMRGWERQSWYGESGSVPAAHVTACSGKAVPARLSRSGLGAEGSGCAAQGVAAKGLARRSLLGFTLQGQSGRCGPRRSRSSATWLCAIRRGLARRDAVRRVCTLLSTTGRCEAASARLGKARLIPSVLGASALSKEGHGSSLPSSSWDSPSLRGGPGMSCLVPSRSSSAKRGSARLCEPVKAQLVVAVYSNTWLSPSACVVVRRSRRRPARCGLSPQYVAYPASAMRGEAGETERRARTFRARLSRLLGTSSK